MVDPHVLACLFNPKWNLWHLEGVYASFYIKLLQNSPWENVYHQTHPGIFSEIKEHAKQVGLLSFWASWLPCFHMDGVVWLWIPKVLRHSSDRQSPQMLVRQTWRTHTGLPNCHIKDLPCPSAAWSGELLFFAASKKKIPVKAGETFLSSGSTKCLTN